MLTLQFLIHVASRSDGERANELLKFDRAVLKNAKI